MEYKEGMTFKDFIGQKKKRGKTKLHPDFTMKDYMEYYKHSVWRYQGGLTRAGTRRKRMAKNSKWILTPVQYKKILSSINILLLEATLRGEDIELPEGFGVLYARQKPVVTKVDDKGNLKTNRAVNWKETLNLWYEDKEARETKQVVYQENCKAKPLILMQFGDFTNKRFLFFNPIHKIMRNISQTMGKGELILPPIGASTRAIKDL